MVQVMEHTKAQGFCPLGLLIDLLLGRLGWVGSGAVMLSYRHPFPFVGRYMDLLVP